MDLTTPTLLQIESPEQFGILLTKHFLATYRQVSYNFFSKVASLSVVWSTFHNNSEGLIEGIIVCGWACKTTAKTLVAVEPVLVYVQVISAKIYIEQAPWKRIKLVSARMPCSVAV